MSPSDRLWRTARRWLYIGHRWSGIALCLLFAIWFVSGVVMMYVPFPSFRAPERIAGAQPIDWRRVHVGPREALASLGVDAFPSEFRLEAGQVGGPVYRLVTPDGRRALSAETGREVTQVSADQAKAIASAFVHAPAASVEPVDHDQWVVTRAYARMAPFWRVRMADGAATDIYVAQQTGEIVQNTTAHERFWNWLGAVPHWIYFTALRVHQEPWRQTVIWTSGIGIFGAIAGIWIGILRVRLRKRYRSGSVSPYRGWMKWHHVAGLIGGVFLVTWVFSGWLSMSPFGGFRDADSPGIAKRYASEKPGFPATDITALARSASGAREVGFTWLGGHPVAIAQMGDARERLIDGASGTPQRWAPQQIEAIAKAAMRNGKLVSVQRIDRYDLYWYGTGDPRSDARPLPVLRLVFDDPSATWLHIDPTTGQLLGQAGSGRRTYRWLFSALHSFDLPWLLLWRPVRDTLMIILSIAGLLISVSGIVVGWRHLFGRKPLPKRKGAAT